jgi:putative Mg2+ transporter-C (MgtC) family protein
MDWLGPFAESEIGLGAVVVRMLAAVVLGAVIGFEREYLARPAGLRTHILVSLAAALFTIVALEFAHREIASDAGLSIDPTRVVEAVTAGVAFLAAGSIIRSRGDVKGLTTGAGLWLAGAIGTACGIGTIAIGAIAAAFGLVVLTLFRLLERQMPRADGNDGQKRE